MLRKPDTFQPQLTDPNTWKTYEAVKEEGNGRLSRLSSRVQVLPGV